MKKLYIFLIIFFCIFGAFKVVLAEDICPFDRELGIGSENSSVKELQKFLSLDKSVYSGPITGYFGSLTKKAVQNFQEKAGLLSNGKVDLATATVLCQVYLSYKTSEPVNNEDSLTVSNSCFLKTLNLEIGYYNGATEEVLQLQKWLANNGFYPEKIFTGYFGSLTKKAVQRFQKSQGIIQTGIVGEKTTKAICGSTTYSDSNISGSNTDLAISYLDINPKEINIGTTINILMNEKNISDESSGSHITSFYINEREIINKNIPPLSNGKEYESINYDWKCEQKGIYIFKFFVDSKNELIEGNKYNNVLVFPVNCGGVISDFKYSCNVDTGSCEIDASGSMTPSECSSSCKKGDKSLPDLLVKSFSPSKIKINETLPLQIVERNDGNSKAERHEYELTVEFGGDKKSQKAVFNELEAKSEQEASGNWTCKVAGVYTITINLDPNDNIKESNETNNKKSFKIECADENGKVPDNEEKEEEKEDQSGDQTGDDKPDIVVSVSPSQMSNGKNTINLDIKNDSAKSINTTFYLTVDLVDANNKTVDSNKMEIKSLGAGQSISGNPFKDQVECNPDNAFKYVFTADSTNTINEKIENNNSASTVCGSIKNETGGSGSGGGGEKSSSDPCYSGNAEIQIKEAKAQLAVDGSGKTLANNYVVAYNISNIKSNRAEGVKVLLYNGSNMIKSANISSLYGCKSYSSTMIYTCQGDEKSITLKVEYDGTKSASQTISVDCKSGQTATGIPYCELDKAISSSGEVRISPGENIYYMLKITGGTVENSQIHSWTGATMTSVKSKAYKSFNGYANGKYPISGVKVTVIYNENGTSKLADILCPDVNVIVTTNSSGGGKVPNLSSDTQCITNLDLSGSMNGDLCFTNYISDLNGICSSTSSSNTMKYAWAYKSGSSISGKTSKTACVPRSQFKDLPVGETEVLLSTASCDYNSETYSQSVKCYVNAFKSSSGSGSGSLVASCSASPSSAKTNETVTFNVNVSKSGFSSGKCSTLKYYWNNSSSDSGSSSYKTSFSSTGSKSVPVKVVCSDDSSKYTTTNCNVSISSSSSGGYDPNPSNPVGSGNLSATCKCGSTGCNVAITGSSTDYNAYTCTWTINGAVKSYVSTCKGINASNINSGSVKVLEDSTGKSVSTSCSVN